jgi:hypothetical protein
MHPVRQRDFKRDCCKPQEACLIGCSEEAFDKSCFDLVEIGLVRGLVPLTLRQVRRLPLCGGAWLRVIVTGPAMWLMIVRMIVGVIMIVVVVVAVVVMPVHGRRLPSVFDRLVDD